MPITDHHQSPGKLRFLDRRDCARYAGPDGDRQIRVVVADRMRLIRASLRAVLDGEADIALVGEAADTEELIAVAGELTPDVVVMAADLPGPDAADAMRRIRGNPCAPGVPVLVLAALSRGDDLLRYLQAGARGVLVEDIEPGELRHAVRVVASGGTQLSSPVMNRVIEQFTTAPRRWPPSAPESFAQLTAREREIVTLVARGLANGEIAERLIISPATAKTHVSRAMSKLQVRDRAKLVALAYETGFVRPSAPATGTPPRRDPAGRACAEDHDRASGPSRRPLLGSSAPGACADG